MVKGSGAVPGSHPRQRTGPKPRPLGDRLWARVAFGRGDGCWEWTGSFGSRGYGQISGPIRSHPIGTHRASWIVTHGPIPDNIFVLHRCDNRACVRPDHLFLGNAAENTTDALSKGRPIGRPRKDRT